MTLTDDITGESCKLPVMRGTIGPDVIDVRGLYGAVNKFTFDPGFGATGSCISELTYIDGDEGILRERAFRQYHVQWNFDAFLIELHLDAMEHLTEDVVVALNCLSVLTGSFGLYL